MIEELTQNYKYYNKNFFTPCLVHATNITGFKEILMQGEIKPNKMSEKLVQNMSGQLEKDVKLNRCIWLSIGFVYNSQDEYGLDYGFIFNPDILDNSFFVFKYHIMSLIHKEMIRFWRDFDSTYLISIMNSKKSIKEILIPFLLRDEMLGREECNKFGDFKWWKIKTELFEAYDNYHDKRKLLSLFKETISLNKIRHFKKEFIVKTFNDGIITSGETISFKNIKLNNENLCGFFIKKNTIKNVKLELSQFLADQLNVNSINLYVFDSEKKNLLNETLLL